MAERIEITKTKQNILKRRNIETDEDLLNVYPKAYMDFRTVYESVKITDANQTGCFIGIPDDLKRDFNILSQANIDALLVLIIYCCLVCGSRYSHTHLHYLCDSQ